MKAIFGLACAPLTRKSCGQLLSIVESTVVVGAFVKERLKGLRIGCAVKVASTVLRRGSGSNAASLSDSPCHCCNLTTLSCTQCK